MRKEKMAAALIILTVLAFSAHASEWKLYKYAPDDVNRFPVFKQVRGQALVDRYMISR